MRCQIIPPYVPENVEKNDPSGARRARARIQRLIDERFRLGRSIPSAVEPQVGEQREIQDAQNRETTSGPTVRVEDSPDGPDPIVNAFYDHLGDTSKYYFDVHNRRGLDGQGGLLLGIAHFANEYDNAFYTVDRGRRIMVCGDGDVFAPFAYDRGVITHELTHGVTEEESPLTYHGQSGALNEHLSDAFAALCDQYIENQPATAASWLIGAVICKGRIQRSAPGPAALRDMLHPGTAYDDPIIGTDPQPADMAHLYTGTQDSGGVHINSGILNRAFATAAVLLEGFSWETVGPVWYAARQGLPASCTFHQFAAATVTASPVGRTRDAVVHGWQTVGIDPTAPGPEPEPTPSPCLALLHALTPEERRVVVGIARRFSAQARKLGW